MGKFVDSPELPPKRKVENITSVVQTKSFMTKPRLVEHNSQPTRVTVVGGPTSRFGQTNFVTGVSSNTKKR